LAAGALVVAGVEFLVVEAVCAAAWQDPAYSYRSNYISDLEVRGPTAFAGHLIASPLGLAMSVAFIVNGVLVAAAGALLLPALRRHGPAVASLVLSLLYGTGLVIAGLFHEVRTPGLHSLGANLCIPPGNLAAVLVAVLARRLGAPARAVRTVGGLGVVGLVGVYLLRSVHGTQNIGLVERIAVYPMLLAEILIGGYLLSTRHRPTREHS
jgi:hypothetical membrane protein